MSLLLVFLGVVVTSIVAPTWLGYLTNKNNEKVKKDEWKRQDDKEEAERTRHKEATEQTEKVADLVEVQTKVVKVVADASVETQEKLDRIEAQAKRIHLLVNSDMTAARQAELDQTRMTLVMLRRVIALGKARGVNPTEEDIEALEETKHRIDDLEVLISDRQAQDERLKKEAEEQPVKLEDDNPPKDGE